MTAPTDRILIQQDDLTEMDVDAIVNAANNDLILGAGVAGAIARKGGESIQRECDEIGSIPVGYAAITGGGKLKARHVIHAASMSLGGMRTTAKTLRTSTAHSLRLAAERNLKSIATRFPGPPLPALPPNRIRRFGPTPFAEYMGESFYPPVHGSFSHPEVRRFSDYYPSVDVLPILGRLPTRQFAEMWRQLDRP